MKNIQTQQIVTSSKQEFYDLLPASEPDEIFSDKSILKIEVLFFALFSISIYFILFTCIAIDRLFVLA